MGVSGQMGWTFGGTRNVGRTRLVLLDRLKRRLLVDSYIHGRMVPLRFYQHFSQRGLGAENRRQRRCLGKKKLNGFFFLCFRNSQPSDVSVVIEFLAKHWGIGIQDTINQVFETYSQLTPPQKNGGG